MAGRIRRALTQLLTPGNPEVVAFPQKPALAVRSPDWSTVRRRHLVLQPNCALCGGSDDLDVHHCHPYHLFPKFELEGWNLITLCTPHHFLMGHLMNWKAWNPAVREDVQAWCLKIGRRKYGA